jgi:hypothetical protein|tara:strand:- start:23 stop:430 length:408 start_codon:yes stop_codon:yes gene_type:complete
MRMRKHPGKKDIKISKEMDNGEARIKYNENFTYAELICKSKQGYTVGIPLEWKDRDCLKAVLEEVQGCMALIRKLFDEGKINVDKKSIEKWAVSMSGIEGACDIINAHMSKDDLFIIREPALSDYSRYLKNIGAK